MPTEHQHDALDQYASGCSACLLDILKRVQAEYQRLVTAIEATERENARLRRSALVAQSDYPGSSYEYCRVCGIAQGREDSPTGHKDDCWFGAALGEMEAAVQAIDALELEE